MMQLLSFSILLAVFTLFFNATDAPSSKLITCGFRLEPLPNITQVCSFPGGTNTTRFHLSVYRKKKSDQSPVRIVDCMTEEGKEGQHCDVEPGYYYDGIMHNNYTSIQIINASDSHLGTYECQLAGSGLQIGSCEFTEEDLVKVHQTLETQKPDWTTRLTTKRTSSAEDDNLRRDLAIGFGVSTSILLIIITVIICFLWRRGYLKGISCPLKKTPEHIKKDEEERETLMNERPQVQEEQPEVSATTESRDDINGQGMTEPEASTAPTADCSRPDNEGEVSLEPSNTTARYVPDRTQADPQAETDEGAMASQIEAASTPLKPHQPTVSNSLDPHGTPAVWNTAITPEEAKNEKSTQTVHLFYEGDRPKSIEEQVRSSKNDTQRPRAAGAHTYNDKTKDTSNYEGRLTCVFETSSSAPEEAKNQKSTQTVHLFYEGDRPITVKNNGTEVTVAPSGEKTKDSTPNCPSPKGSDQDVSLSALKLRHRRETTDVEKMDEKKSVASEGHATKESSGAPEPDRDVREPRKTTKGEQALSENAYSSGGSSVFPAPVQEVSYTQTLTKLAVASERKTPNTKENCSSSFQDDQNSAAAPTSLEDSAEINAQQDVSSRDVNVSLATSDTKEVREGEEPETVPLSPSAGGRLNMRNCPQIQPPE